MSDFTCASTNQYCILKMMQLRHFQAEEKWKSIKHQSQVMNESSVPPPIFEQYNNQKSRISPHSQNISKCVITTNTRRYLLIKVPRLNPYKILKLMIFNSISKTMIGHDAFLLIHCTIESRFKIKVSALGQQLY